MYYIGKIYGCVHFIPIPRKKKCPFLLQILVVESSKASPQKDLPKWVNIRPSFIQTGIRKIHFIPFQYIWIWITTASYILIRNPQLMSWWRSVFNKVNNWTLFLKTPEARELCIWEKGLYILVQLLELHQLFLMTKSNKKMWGECSKLLLKQLISMRLGKRLLCLWVRSAGRCNIYS